MVAYKIKREVTDGARSGCRIRGQLSDTGGDIAATTDQLLSFGRENTTVALADLLPGKRYRATARIYGERNDSMKISMKPVSGNHAYAEKFTAKIPANHAGRRTAYGYAFTDKYLVIP